MRERERGQESVVALEELLWGGMMNGERSHPFAPSIGTYRSQSEQSPFNRTRSIERDNSFRAGTLWKSVASLNAMARSSLLGM